MYITQLEVSKCLTRVTDYVYIKIKEQMVKNNAWPLPKESGIQTLEPVDFKAPLFIMATKDKGHVFLTSEKRSAAMRVYLLEEFVAGGHKVEGAPIKDTLQQYLDKYVYPWPVEVDIMKERDKLERAPLREEVWAARGFVKGKGNCKTGKKTKA